MLQTVWAVLREGKVELVDNIPLPEGARAIVTLLTGERSLAEVWENAEVNVYAELLRK